MSVSLITSFVGTALNLGQAAKQKRLAEQAARQAEIDTEKAFRAIEKSKILDLELPMQQYRRQEQLISQQTRQAVEAAREAGPRGVAAIPRIQAAGTEAFANLGAMQEKALIGLRNLEEQQRVRGELAEAELRAEAATGAQLAAAEARKAEADLITSGLKSFASAIGEATKFDPDKRPYPPNKPPDEFFISKGAKQSAEQAAAAAKAEQLQLLQESTPTVDLFGSFISPTIGSDTLSALNQFMKYPKTESVITF